MLVRPLLTALALAALLVASACGSDTGADEPEGRAGADDEREPALDRPDGPAADVSEVVGGDGEPLLAVATTGSILPDTGWVEEERIAAGTATSYRAVGELPADGRFALEEADSADYRTRVVVRRPEAASDFNGTVVVEWLNVSGGFDANPDWAYLADELVRGGYAWVGVSAQAIGVEGGPVAVGVDVEEAGGLAGRGLKAIDPERYGTLSHPGDAFSYDIYTQVGRSVRDAGSGILGDLEPARVLAVGESQSAFTLTTYANGVQPLTRAFDGFLLHSRGGAAAPLGEGGGAIDIASAIAGPPTQVRTDTEVPVLILESETDLVSVIGYLPARQDDTDRIRLWEMAGTAHADRYITGAVADGLDCGAPINDGPQHYVVKAALRSLDRWVGGGEAPPEAPRLETEEVEGRPAIRRDADGIALGGIRTPHVDAPVDVLSGEPGPNPSVICLLLGSTRPLPEARLAERYADADAYLDAFEAATDEAIDAGFVLDDDRARMLDDARPGRIRG